VKRAALALTILTSACTAQDELGANTAALVGGAPTALFPEVVAIGARPTVCTARLDSACTGTLIGPRSVLTAAHCMSTGELSVFVGSDVSVGGELRHVVASAVHPDYDEETHDADLAVITLDRPAPMAPMPFATAPLDGSAVGMLVTVVGFGTEKDSAPTGIKRVGESRIRSVEGATFESEEAPAMSCRGDSGGPLLRAKNGGFELMGLTASGDVKCEDRARNIDVGAFASFVRDALAASEAFRGTRPAALLGSLCTHTCAIDEDCSAGFQCELGADGVGHCANAPLPAASYMRPCTDDRECGGGICANVVSEARCLCADVCAVDLPSVGPTMRATGGGCGLGRASGFGGLGVVGALAIALCRRSRSSHRCSPRSSR